MKYIIFLSLLTVGITSKAQSTLDIIPYAGYNLPLNGFSDFAENGMTYGIAADVFFGAKFGIGFEANEQRNNAVYSFDFSRIPTSPSYTFTTNETGQWNSRTLAVGPVYRMGSKKITLDAYLKVGSSTITIPELKTTFGFNSVQRNLFAFSNYDDVNIYSLTSGLRFNANITKRLALFINPQYTYTQSPLSYGYRTLAKAFQTSGGTTTFFPEILLDEPLIEQNLDITSFGLNVGIKLKLGEKNGKNTSSPSIEECLRTSTISPKNKAKYNLSLKDRPNFKWNNTDKSVDYFVFKLYKDGKEVFTEETKNQYKLHDKKLEKIYKKSNEKNLFSWQIITYYKDCELRQTALNFFSLNSSGAFHHLHSITCGNPAINADGSRNYTARLTFFNNSAASDPIEIENIANSVTITEPSGGIISGFNSCQDNVFLLSFLSISPGETELICINITVPNGTNQILTNVTGEINNISQSSNAQNFLEPCDSICNVCETWQIEAGNTNVTPVFTNLNDGTVSFDLSAGFRIPNAEPIQEVRAEIISIQHTVNNPECYTCAKDETKMGLFNDVGNRVTSRIVAGDDWINNRNAFLSDEIGNGGSNEISWKAISETGVDLSIRRQQFVGQIVLPQIRTLDCCKSKFRVCVRYTFIDINCIACDSVVCFEYDSGKIGSEGRRD